MGTHSAPPPPGPLVGGKRVAVPPQGGGKLEGPPRQNHWRLPLLRLVSAESSAAQRVLGSGPGAASPARLSSVCSV